MLQPQEFPHITSYGATLADTCAAAFALPRNTIRLVFSPYRVCPLGAHLDHQGGHVLGFTINAGTLLAYAPAPDASISLRSRNFPGIVHISLDDPLPASTNHWSDYLRCVVRAFRDSYPLSRGFIGMCSGMLPACGLSSSASVILAYAFALADVNQLTLQPWDFVRLAHQAENTYFGLRNGILDQTTILFGQENNLVHIDTRNEQVELIPQPRFAQHCRILVVFSGLTRQLISTDYNKRVAECQRAASLLASHCGLPHARVLSDIPLDVFPSHLDLLPPHLHRRALHFFSESQRVQQGIHAWRNADFSAFGALMNASCRSSLELYEVGSPLIRQLHQLLSSAPGVLGARFNGGGFGGCLVALVTRSLALRAAQYVIDSFFASHPSLRDHASIYLANSSHALSSL
ncbi:MAG: hypothetical protein N2595_05470 [bacterium]|nr:hypothetical protein [bacterium]